MSNLTWQGKLGCMLIGLAILNSNLVFANTKKSSNKKSTQRIKTTKKRRYIRQKSHSDDYMEGVASCYANKFIGRKTSSGAKFVMDKFTGASPTLAMHTKVKVTNLYNQKVVYIEINDRMALSSGHVLDLPKLPANWLGLSCPSGMTKVKLEVVNNEIYQNALNAQIAGDVFDESYNYDIINQLSESGSNLGHSESITLNQVEESGTY